MKRSFYGDEAFETITYLEFGSIHLSKQTKSTWAYVMHQEAYDLYMFSRYAKDLFLFRDVSNLESPTSQDFLNAVMSSSHRKLFFIALKYAGYLVVKDYPKPIRVCEIGSSLFGLIDEIAALDAIMNKGRNIACIRQGKYIGCEISDMMNRGATEFHPQASFDLHTDSNASAFLQRSLKYDFFYAHSISLQYSLRSTAELAEISRQGSVSVFLQAAFSVKGPKMVDIGTGKKGFHPDLKEWVKLIEIYGLSAKFYSKGIFFDAVGGDKTNHLLDSLRITLVVGKSDLLDRFVSHFNDISHIFSASFEEPNLDMDGQWHDLSELTSFCKNHNFPISI